MGCTHSQSEDLRQRSSLLHSQTFMDSLEDVPGYFNRTMSPTDYLSSDLESAHSNKQEMSYTGPPSHLQNSADVHPFWYEYGRDYHPKERFIDRSLENIPTSLLPRTQTAAEMRNIEIRETMASLRRQVRDVWITKIDEEDTDETSPSFSSSDVDGNMTQEEKSTLDFFESMINDSIAFDTDSGGNSLNVPDKSAEDKHSWNGQEPTLPSLLPEDLNHHTVGHVHSVVSEHQKSPQEGSPLRTVLSNHASSKKASLLNGHASFLQNNVYLPKENSITGYHRKLPLSPSRSAPPPPTKPKPKLGVGNKRNSYPITGSQPTEFGANFLVAHKHKSQVSLKNQPNDRPRSHLSIGNQPNGNTQSITQNPDISIKSDFENNNEQNESVKNIVQRFNKQTHHPQLRHSQSTKSSPLTESRTPQIGFRHSMYADMTQYDYNNVGINVNMNNSKMTLGVNTDHSAVDVCKDITSEDHVLQGIESDLLPLQVL